MKTFFISLYNESLDKGFMRKSIEAENHELATAQAINIWHAIHQKHNQPIIKGACERFALENGTQNIIKDTISI